MAKEILANGSTRRFGQSDLPPGVKPSTKFADAIERLAKAEDHRTMSATHYDWEQDIEDNRKPLAAIDRENLEKLKADWSKDPCWDLEDSEGFEDYREELLAYSTEQKAEWERKQREYRERVPERFRGMFFTDTDDIPEYLNKQAAEGYNLVSLTPAHQEDIEVRYPAHPGVYALVEKKPL